MVPYELPIEERNYFLLLFSKGEKRRLFIAELIARHKVELLQFAYDLYPNEVKEVVRMSKADDVIDLDANARFIVQDIGPKRILEVITPEELAAYVSPEERLAGISREVLEEQLARLDDGGHSRKKPRRKARKTAGTRRQ